MASSEALQKFEQAKAFIEEARALVEEKNGADAKELQELKKQLRQKDRELQQKEQLLQRKDRELKSKVESLEKALEKSKQPVKTFIEAEVRQSYGAVLQAKQAHLQSPSKYTAGFIELAKGSHAENEEMFKRLAHAVGVDFGSLALDLGSLEIDEKKGEVTVEVVALPQKKSKPREAFHLSRYIDRSPKLARRDSAVAQ